MNTKDKAIKKAAASLKATMETPAFREALEAPLTINHTPAPWYVFEDPNHGLSVGTEGKLIAPLSAEVSEMEGNAQLIAAAPELLRALIGAFRLVEYAKDKGAYIMLGGDHYIQTGNIHSALCKALGLDYKTVSCTNFLAAVDQAEKLINQRS